MLMITRLETDRSVTLRFEGKLLSPWVREARAQYERTARHGRAVNLDLGQLTFVDNVGTAFLRELLARGVKISSCTNYVAELLELERD